MMQHHIENIQVIKADIVYPEEAHHIQGKAFSLMSNSNEFISSLMHTKEQKLRMASWDKWLGDTKELFPN